MNSIWGVVAILAVVYVLLVSAYVYAPLPGRGRRRAQFRRLVRCDQGHVFYRQWIPGVSTAIRYGRTRGAWCPVGCHPSIIRRIDPHGLTSAERTQLEDWVAAGSPRA